MSTERKGRHQRMAVMWTRKLVHQFKKNAEYLLTWFHSVHFLEESPSPYVFCLVFSIWIHSPSFFSFHRLMQYVIVIGTENIGLFGTLSDYNTKYKCDFMRMGEDEECLKIIMVCVTWFPYKITLNNFSSQVLLNASFRFVSLIVCMRVSLSRSRSRSRSLSFSRSRSLAIPSFNVVVILYSDQVCIVRLPIECIVATSYHAKAHFNSESRQIEKSA